VIHRTVPGWRIASLAALIGLLGWGTIGLVWADAPGASSAKHPGSGGDALRLAGPPGPAGSGGPPGITVGLELLREAVTACQDTSYSGSEFVLWWGPDETSASVVEVWHQPGRLTLVEAADPAGLSRARAAADQDPDGILGMSGELLALLQANYQVVYAGHGSADGRGALIVDVLRPDGGLAARFWLDAATKLPLRREMFAAGHRLISDDAFTRIELADPGPERPSAAAGARWPAQLDRARLAALRARGWQLPDQLPGKLSLFAVNETATRSGQVINLSYSDGLAVVSVFVQRGELGRPLSGWRPVTLDGRTIYSVNPAERSFAWSAGGFVYTLVADAPMRTVSQVVAALPGPGRLGFWERMGRGLRRLVSWVNPLR